MSYQSQSQLEQDYFFQSRVRSCCIEQAETFKDAADAAFKALAEGVLRDDGGCISTFVRIEAGAPGIADKADNGDGTVDSAKVTDADMLSLTQANWPVVAGLYFDETGAPI